MRTIAPVEPDGLSSVDPDVPIESSEDLPIVVRTMDGGTTQFVRCADALPSSHPSPARSGASSGRSTPDCQVSSSASPRADPEDGPNRVPCGSFHETLMADHDGPISKTQWLDWPPEPKHLAWHGCEVFKGEPRHRG